MLIAQKIDVKKNFCTLVILNFAEKKIPALKFFDFLFLPWA